MGKPNINNLKIAREGLMGLDPELLHMNRFRKNDSYNAVEFASADDCGTFGCALGWCPMIKGLEPIKEDFNTHASGKKYLDFGKYCKRVFKIEGRDASNIWDYLFHQEWWEKDNSVEGLIKRLTKVIDGKKITRKDLPY